MVLFPFNIAIVNEHREWLLQTTFVPLVPSTLSALDVYPHRSPLFVLVLLVQPPTTSEQAAHRHGGNLLLFVYVQQDRESLYLQSV